MPSIDIVRRDENPHETVHGFRTDTASRGTDLAGAKITATYSDGTTETLTWIAYDPYTNGGTSGDNIEMSYGWDWHNLTTTKPLASLKIDLQPASSVFDTTYDYNDFPSGISTPGSKNGFPFELDTADQGVSGDITVTYSGTVNIAGSPAVGDIYTTMEIDFSQLPAGGFLGLLKWNSDIDTLEVPGDLLPSPATCLVRGTLVTTDLGEIPVEELKSGCKILTRDNGFQELVVTTSRVVEAPELRRNERLFPVRITAGALGRGYRSVICLFPASTAWSSVPTSLDVCLRPTSHWLQQFALRSFRGSTLTTLSSRLNTFISSSRGMKSFSPNLRRPRVSL
ncbi:Hint domain-containing protein [Paracoccus cavernae]|uniref:Hint domain-containing protein n=1 Tax=Paracoccus cavernae TaxID=1571207 RepID=A0ABT8D5M4_9RHOB|nr:Hint domain-containing protein [Paracoccus cavernae]